jgi:hypothetical protein
MTTQTPGPWHYDGHGINRPDGVRIATFEDTAYPTFDEEGCYARSERQDADGKLIAAAPDLLKCVEMLAAIQLDNVPWWFTECHDMAVKLTSSK